MAVLFPTKVADIWAKKCPEGGDNYDDERRSIHTGAKKMDQMPEKTGEHP